MTKKKVVLIAPPNDFASNANVTQFTLLLAPPLSILALGSYLSMHDVPIELIDVQMDFGFGMTHAAEQLVAQRLAQYLYEQIEEIAWIGISQLSNATTGIVIAQEIHAALPDIPIIFGGYFPSSAYRSLLEEYPFITAIVRSDGEEAALAISHSLEQGRSFLRDEIPNLAWLHNEKIYTTPVRPMAPGNLPISDFTLLHNPSNYQIVNMMTARGCPFQCNYCLESNMRPYAVHPPSWVDQQLAHLEAEMPNDHVFIYDPIFGLSRKRTREMCQVLCERRFTYGVESRGDVLAPDLVPTLRETGIETIYLGIESASEETLLRMNKASSTAQVQKYLTGTREILKACFENDLTPVVGFMPGFPGDTEMDYQITLEFVKDIRQLHDRVVAETGVMTGFALFTFYTKIYEGSSLAERVAEDFPEAILRSEPFIGERSVFSPSPGLEMDVIQHYRNKIVQHGSYTPLTLERLWRYYSFSLNSFLAEHPELTNDEGVTMLGDYLRRFPQSYNAAAMMTQYDKSKN